jgi:hypothetical protein
VHLTFSNYRKFLLLALSLLLAMPCFAKRELKQWLTIETSPQAKSENPRISCTSFVRLNKQSNKQEVNKIILPGIITPVDSKYSSISDKVRLRDFYNQQKEKIPSYICFRQFLI